MLPPPLPDSPLQPAAAATASLHIRACMADATLPRSYAPAPIATRWQLVKAMPAALVCVQLHRSSGPHGNCLSGVSLPRSVTARPSLAANRDSATHRLLQCLC